MTKLSIESPIFYIYFFQYYLYLFKINKLAEKVRSLPLVKCSRRVLQTALANGIPITPIKLITSIIEHD